MKKIAFIVLFHFCWSALSIAQHYVFYGVTGGGGGKNGGGMIYKYDPINGKFDTLYSLNTASGELSGANLLLAKNGLLYGSSATKGEYNRGTLFSFNPLTNKLSILLSFDSTYSGNYCCDNGNNLMQAKNSLLYGTREMGGDKNFGFLYSFNISTGKDSILYNFDSVHGSYPNCTVVEDTSNGYFYGTTLDGGIFNNGVLFRHDLLFNRDTVLINFDTANSNIGLPKGNTFIFANNGMLYGETNYGGDFFSHVNPSEGTIYSFNTNTNKDTLLFKFTESSGCGPFWSNLMQASNGLLYGITSGYGLYDNGTLFCYNISTRNVTVLLNFNGSNGSFPLGSLIQDPENGVLYGITQNGGAYNMGVLFCYNIITGKDSVLVNFDGTNGAYPEREPTLVLDTDNLGINELRAKSGEVRVVPNPNNGIFQLAISNEQLVIKSTVEIYNMLGQEVYSNSFQPIAISHQLINIDLSGEPSGIYLYRVVTEKGELEGEGKFVIER